MAGIRVRALATNVLDSYSINNNVKDEVLGEAGSRAWRWRLNAGYFWPRLSVSGTLRGFNDGVYDASWHSGVEIDNNRIKGTNYFDFAANYSFLGNGDRAKLTGFFVVENLFDRAPAVVGGPNLANLQTDTLLYDTIGRTMRVGIRYQF